MKYLICGGFPISRLPGFNNAEDMVSEAFTARMKGLFPQVKVLAPREEGFDPPDAIAKAVAILQANLDDVSVGPITEDRKSEGLLFNLAARESITVNSLPKVSRWQWLDRRKESAVAETCRRLLAIRAPPVAAMVGRLTGGNQQKVVLANGRVVDSFDKAQASSVRVMEGVTGAGPDALRS